MTGEEVSASPPFRLPRVLRAAVVLGVMALGVAGGWSAPQAFTATPQMQRAVVIAKPSLVHLIVDVTGSLRDGDGAVHGPYHDTLSGSGSFVDRGGDILTAAHVGAPTPVEIKQTLALRYINETQCSTGGNCNAVIRNQLPQIMTTFTVQDLTVGVRALTQDVNLPTNATASDAYRVGVDARVVASSPSTSLDLAVLHIDSHDDPAVLLRQPASTAGMQVAVVGFPPSATFSVPPSFNYGTVKSFGHGSASVGLPSDPSAVGVAADANIIGVDAYAEHGDSGGPAVDDTGSVIGLVSFGADPSGPVRAAFLISADDIRTILTQAGVTNVLSPADTAWRAGLTAFDGGDSARALEQFRACVAASPLNVGCRDWIATASGQQSPSGGRSTVLVVAVAVVALAGAAALCVGLVWTMRRRRRNSQRRALFRG